MTTKNKSTLHNKNRRNALAGIVATGAIATVWKKPLVNAVILPAHAQTSISDLDFFATQADAAVAGDLGQQILGALVPTAHAIQQTNEVPLEELVFEAEAINQGADTFKIRIAAERVKARDKVASSSREFIFGWEGTLSGLNTNSTLTEHGCADAETGRITAIGSSSLSIEMSYFSQTISLELVDGSADLPSFPFSCAA